MESLASDFPQISNSQMSFSELLNQTSNNFEYNINSVSPFYYCYLTVCLFKVDFIPERVIRSCYVSNVKSEQFFQ